MAENVVREQLEKLRSASLTGIYKMRLDESGRIAVSGNDEALGSWLVVAPELIGLPEGAEVTFRNLSSALYKNDKRAAVQRINQAIAAGEDEVVSTLSLVRSDGEEIWLKSILTVERDATGRPVYINGSLRDISSELRAVADIRQMGERLSRVLREVPIAVFRIDMTIGDHEAMYYASTSGHWMINAGMLYGVEDDEIRSPLNIIKYLHADDREAVSNVHMEAAKRGLDRYEVEYRTVWPDGSLHWIASKTLVERDGNDEIIAINGIQYDITERKLQQQHIEFMAGHDALTDLPNRALCMETLIRTVAAGKRYGRSFAVMYVDLDRFKEVNDTLGHDVGDKLLVEISHRFCGALRASEFIARLGGDEFMVIAEGVSDPSQAQTVAEKLLHAAIAPLDLMGKECRVTASIGVSLFPGDGDEAQVLMKNADIALYAAKESGKNRFAFYSAEMAVRSLQRLDLEMQLRSALAKDEFSLHYQPKVNSQTHAITGVEALLRWQNGKLGAVSPTQFIPVAEESGLIVPIGKWVLETSCRQMAAWQAAGFNTVPVAVNVSPRQFAEKCFYEDVRNALECSGIAPQLLELELTEGMIMRDIERAVGVLTAIKALGVRVAVDDFGTGYSSLAQIRRFPIDTLKIDRSFVHNIHNDSEGQAITDAIFNMAKSLSLTVVAEGVETADEASFLRASSCDEMQGFYFSKPISGDEFAKLLSMNITR